MGDMQVSQTSNIIYRSVKNVLYMIVAVKQPNCLQLQLNHRTFNSSAESGKMLQWPLMEMICWMWPWPKNMIRDVVEKCLEFCQTLVTTTTNSASTSKSARTISMSPTRSLKEAPAGERRSLRPKLGWKKGGEKKNNLKHLRPQQTWFLTFGWLFLQPF